MYGSIWVLDAFNSYDMDKAELRNHIEELNAEILEIKNKIQESLL